MSTPTCTNCGLPNAPNAGVCARCGAPLGAAGPPPNWAPPPRGAAPPPATGRSTAATIAIVLGVVAVFGLVLVGIVAAIAIPSLMRARAAANESSAIGTLRTIASAEATYEAAHGEYGSLADLARAGYVDPNLTNGSTRNGYVFREVHVSDVGFEFSAEPSGQATSASRSFNVTDDFIVRFAEGPTPPRGTSGRNLGQ